MVGMGAAFPWLGQELLHGPASPPALTQLPKSAALWDSGDWGQRGCFGDSKGEKKIEEERENRGGMRIEGEKKIEGERG